MPRTLIRKDPSNFKTLPLFVEASPDGLSYQSLGQPLNFQQMLERRRPIEVADSSRFSVELANLGVSVRLTLRLHGRDYWLLVRQRRPDRGDGWLSGRFADTWLPTPYQGALRYRESSHFRLSPLSGAARPVQCGNLTLLERPRAYVHLPTASLQLVYDLSLELPRDARQLSLFHVDECLEDGRLVARLERRRPDIYLLALQRGVPSGGLFTLRKGELLPASTRGVWLSESFAEQDGWLVRDERIRWKDWLQRYGVKPPQRRALASA